MIIRISSDLMDDVGEEQPAAADDTNPEESANDVTKPNANEEYDVQAPESCTETEQEEQEDYAPGEELAAGDLQAELDECRKEIDTLSDRHLRLAAEYENFRKRTQREKEQLYSDSVADVVTLLLPIIDNLDRAAEACIAVKTQEAIQLGEGIVLVRKQAYEALNKIGVTEMDCLNQTFDPNLHHAVLHVEDEDCGEGEIIEVLQKGFMYNDRVIRPSMVKVAN